MKLFKLSKVVFMALIIVAMSAPSAFAGSLRWTSVGSAANAVVTVALEAMGAARNYVYSNQSSTTNTTSGGVTIFPGQALASGSLLTVSLTNAGFDGTRVLVCTNIGTGALNDTPIASATPNANATSQGFVLGSAVGASGNLLVLTDNGSSSCNNANSALIVRFQPVTSAAMVKMSYTVALSGTTYDSADAVNIANVASQAASTFLANNTTIDYLNAPANGSSFGGNVTTSNRSSAAITITGMNLNAVTGGVVNAGLTSSAILSLQDTASWQGVRRMYIMNATTACDVANNIAMNNAPSGTTLVSIPAGAYNGGIATANNVAVCADILGNVATNPRTITGATNVSYSGTGAQSTGLSSYSTLMSWMSNGYQGIVPYISGDSLYSTICMIDNKSSASAPVTIDILTTESGATLTSLSGLSVGSVGAGKTIRVDIDSSLHPYTYSGGTETAGTTTALTGVQSNDRLAAQINVGASPTSVVVNCIQKDPAGSKRAVPVLTQTGSTTVWQQ